MGRTTKGSHEDRGVGPTPHWPRFPTQSEGLVTDVVTAYTEARSKARRPTELQDSSFPTVSTAYGLPQCSVGPLERKVEQVIVLSLEGTRAAGSAALPSAGEQKELVERGPGPGSAWRLSGGGAGILTDYLTPIQSSLFKQEKQFLGLFWCVL